MKEITSIIINEETYAIRDSRAGAVAAIAVTEGADGSVTIVNTLADGRTETVVVSADADGAPAGLTYNGTQIPFTWTEAVT